MNHVCWSMLAKQTSSLDSKTFQKLNLVDYLKLISVNLLLILASKSII